MGGIKHKPIGTSYIVVAEGSDVTEFTSVNREEYYTNNSFSESSCSNIDFHYFWMYQELSGLYVCTTYAEVVNSTVYCTLSKQIPTMTSR